MLLVRWSHLKLTSGTNGEGVHAPVPVRLHAARRPAKLVRLQCRQKDRIAACVAGRAAHLLRRIPIVLPIRIRGPVGCRRVAITAGPDAVA